MNILYLIIISLISFVGLYFLLEVFQIQNLNFYIGIVALIMSILSIILTIKFYIESNNLFSGMKFLLTKINIYTERIFEKESARVDRLIGLPSAVPRDKIVEGKFETED